MGNGMCERIYIYIYIKAIYTQTHCNITAAAVSRFHSLPSSTLLDRNDDPKSIRISHPNQMGALGRPMVSLGRK